MALSTPLLKQKQVYLQPSGCCTGISAKQKSNRLATKGGGFFRSGRGQLRETRSTSAAPPSISRSTFPRQHRPKYLSILQGDIHLIEIKYCEDTPATSYHVPFPAILSTLIRRRFQVTPATLLIPIDFFVFLWWRIFTVPGTKVAPFPYLMWGVIFTACIVLFFLLHPSATLSYKRCVDVWCPCREKMMCSSSLNMIYAITKTAYTRISVRTSLYKPFSHLKFMTSSFKLCCNLHNFLFQSWF